MPLVSFESLSEFARVWVFGVDRRLAADDVSRLLDGVDQYLTQWHAHGEPLTCARVWRDDRFLVVGVEGGGASGCSIDGLTRALRSLEHAVGAGILGGGRVFYRDPGGAVLCTTRDEFSDLAAAGVVRGDTRVFDTSITAMHDLRERFERPAASSWHAALFP